MTDSNSTCCCQNRETSSITLLVDNKAGEGLSCVHGFAAWIKIRDRRILFDTGQKNVILENSAKLNIDLSEAEALVLSHGHDDHTGNLVDFYQKNPNAPMFCGQHIDFDRFCCRPGEDSLNWSPPPGAKALFSSLNGKIHVLTNPMYLLPGVGITGPVPRRTSYEDVGDALFLDAQATKPDPVDDDMSMWFETDRGLVVLLGCCHSGVVNTINYIREVSGINKVCGIVGGMHLVRANENRMSQTLKAMESWQMDWLMPCHCTGDQAMQQMVDYLGKDLVSIGHTGIVIELGNLPKNDAHADYALCRHGQNCGCCA